MLRGPQHPASFSTRSPRLSGNNLPSPGEKKKNNNNPNAENKTRNQKGKSVRQKWQLCALDSRSNLSLLIANSGGGVSLLPSGKCKREKSVVHRHSVKTDREEHRSAALRIFTPYFTSALSPPLSARSD